MDMERAGRREAAGRVPPGAGVASPRERQASLLSGLAHAGRAGPRRAGAAGGQEPAGEP